METQRDRAETGPFEGFGRIDRSTPLPLYYQLKRWLSEKISTGELPPGTLIPSEHDLCRQFGVSRGVARQALTEMCYDGLIYRERGRGTFVARPKTVERLMSRVGGLADEVAHRHQVLDSTVLLQREAPAGDVVAERLKIEPGESVLELERLRAVDGEPMVMVLSYLSTSLVPGLVDCDLGGSVSLYQILREKYGLAAESNVRNVEAAVADAREAGLLGIRKGDPLLVLRSVGYTADERPLDYFIAYHRGDRSSFEVVITDGSQSRVASFTHHHHTASQASS